MCKNGTFVFQIFILTKKRIWFKVQWRTPKNFIAPSEFFYCENVLFWISFPLHVCYPIRTRKSFNMNHIIFSLQCSIQNSILNSCFSVWLKLNQLTSVVNDATNSIARIKTWFERCASFKALHYFYRYSNNFFSSVRTFYVHTKVY